MRRIAVGIGGGSGAGKSTLGESLAAREPDTFALIQLDDYFRKSDKVPTVDGRENRDHPESLDFDKFVHDLTELKAGRSIVMMTKNQKYNPLYAETKTKIRIEVRPKPISLAEGFLILYDQRVRALLDKSIWLEAASEIRWNRRVGRKIRLIRDDEYQKKILEPMHREFVEPTRRYADKILDAGSLNEQDILKETEHWFRSYLVSGELKKFR